MKQQSKGLKVLAVGAAGPSASLVIPELVKRGTTVRGFVHNSGKEATARAAGAADVVTGDLSDSRTLVRALAGVNAAFYIAPVVLDDEAEVGKQFVRAAKAAGVRRVVFSSVIHPVLSELDNHAAKAPVEEALLDSGMEYVFLHPAMFFQNLAPSWEQIKQTGTFGEPWSNETRFSRVDYRDVAEVAAIALTEDQLLYGTFELCAEGNLNRHEVAEVMGKVLGRQIAAVKVEVPARDGISSKLSRMFAWYNQHSLLGNPLTLRAILGREARALRSYLEELETKARV